MAIAVDLYYSCGINSITTNRVIWANKCVVLMSSTRTTSNYNHIWTSDITWVNVFALRFVENAINY
jgi:hypothetical protein